MAVQRLLCMPTSHEHQVPCGCGQQARYHETRPKWILTMLGPVTYNRAYFQCPNCHQGHSPGGGNWTSPGRSVHPEYGV